MHGGGDARHEWRHSSCTEMKGSHECRHSPWTRSLCVEAFAMRRDGEWRRSSLTAVEKIVQNGDVGHAWRRSSCVQVFAMHGGIRLVWRRSTYMEAFAVHGGARHARRSSSYMKAFSMHGGATAASARWSGRTKTPPQAQYKSPNRRTTNHPKPINPVVQPLHPPHLLVTSLGPLTMAMTLVWPISR